MTILSTIATHQRQSTRTVQIDRLYTFDGRTPGTPGTEWVEAWTKGVDGIWPFSIVAYTADPMIQDTLRIAKDANSTVVIDVDETVHGLRITGIEEQR